MPLLWVALLITQRAVVHQTEIGGQPIKVNTFGKTLPLSSPMDKEFSITQKHLHLLI